MKTALLIVAAGSGTRLGGPVPKQYQLLGREMILTRTLRTILASDHITSVICVINPEARYLYDQAVDPVSDPRMLAPASGGVTRSESVLNGLEALAEVAPDRVLVHDAARPFISVQLLDTLCTTEDAAILAEPVVDALWRETEGYAETPVPRAGLWRAQTPQAFPFDGILKAHRSDAASSNPALDDAETYRRAGHEVRLIEGSPNNFKITTAADMARAKRLVAQETRMEIRTGHGFDVHRFAPGDHVWLCGVQIPHKARLVGHSRAEVGLHALSHAIYGALAIGDIGTHFPPSDPQWKGTESHVFLSHAAQLIRDRGGRLVNADLTLLCEAPKIKPHAAEMCARMAEILGTTANRVSVKATTMERMGFVGREEGMGCIANVTVEVPE
ncbi:MAG: bifunctional 2-C-methyl-D-erythritol 4-phosphate cytidylyltransferase/2-C-methyl-D-erythritol 2,4-cyclodiphosphate synthase [Paracoccaceae bacterium]